LGRRCLRWENAAASVSGGGRRGRARDGDRAAREREEQHRHVVVLDGPDPDGLYVGVERGEIEDAGLTCGGHGRFLMLRIEPAYLIAKLPPP
jgi:hypothetical protein